ncbi:MAG TPA: CRISPR-associated endonuclease Cas2 [Candidatus Angelobacter sp.]
MTELITMVIYDVEDDWARTLVAEACKDFGLVRIQYSCFRGKLSGNKREELYERFRKIQRNWQQKWYKDLPESRFVPSESPDIPGKPPTGRWQPSFKIMIQPLCEKDVSAATYAYMYMDVPEFAQTLQMDGIKMPTKPGQAEGGK